MRYVIAALSFAVAGCGLSYTTVTSTGPITEAELMEYLQANWDQYRTLVSRASGQPRQATVPEAIGGVRCELRPSDSTCAFDMTVRFEDGSVRTLPLSCDVMRNGQGRLISRPAFT